jgi:iron-sulfur cluster repair protein YtfE (RIC family)
MQLQRHISRRLHEEHMNALALLEQLEQLLGGRKGAWPPPPDDPAWRGFAAKLSEALNNEVSSHFALEENALFGRLTDAGNGDLVDLLLEEHATIRAVVAELLPACALSTRGGAVEPALAGHQDAWAGARRALERHINKENSRWCPRWKNCWTTPTALAMAG